MDLGGGPQDRARPRGNVSPEALRIPTLSDRVAPAAVPIGGVASAVEARNAGFALGGLADRIGALADTLTRRVAQDTEDQAWRAGTIAGEAEPGVQAADGGRVWRNAFDRAAATAGQQRLELMARQQLGELAQQHRTDPAAFSGAAATWRDGIARTLPAELGARFRTGFDILAVPAFNQIREAQQRAVADQAVAGWTEALPARIAGIEQAAGRALEDPAAARAYRVQEDQAIAELVALGPREGFTLGGRQYPPDPSRAAAMSLPQLAQRAEALRAQGREAVVIGAWRAAGGGRAWIDAFERRSVATGPDADWIARNAATGRALASPEVLAARVPAAWQPVIAAAAQQQQLDPQLLTALIGLESGGRANAVSPAGAVGPAQIMPATARDPGFGLPPLPADALTDPARAIPWAAQLLAKLRDNFGGDMARALAAYNAGPRRVQDAARDGRLLPPETRNYLATLLPAAAGGVPLADNETQRIASRLRGLQAAEDAAQAEGRAEARAELARQVQENLAAIGVTGRPVRPLDPDLVARAGEDPLRLGERERAATERFAAEQEARNVTDPVSLQQLADAHAPGTANFRADPQAAVQLLTALRARGVAVADLALTERVRDLEAEAQATGRAGAVSAEEARAAGLTPERRDAINRSLTLTAEIARQAQDARQAPPGQSPPDADRFPVAGDQARENALIVRARAEAQAARAQAISEDAAAYALTVSPPAREAAAAVARGDVARLGELMDLLREEQARQGVPAAQRRALPKALAEPILSGIADAPNAEEALQRLGALTAAVGVERLPALLSGLRLSGAAQDDRREAILVAAALTPRDPGLSRTILRGAILLRDNPAPGLSATRLQPDVDTTLGSAFAEMPAQQAMAVSAARAVYAAEAHAAGTLGAAYDSSRFRAALSRVAPTASYNGQRLPLPPGMSADAFDSLMERLPAAALEGARAADGRPFTPAMAARSGTQLRAVGAGQYFVDWHGFQVLAPDGSRFVLNLTGRQPAADMPRARPAAGRTGAQPIPGWDDTAAAPQPASAPPARPR
jgi:soluble lytic murein transglycosylase-like protein